MLGSTQPDDVVDRERAGEAELDVVRRRTGGGAVLVVPGDLLWIDVFLPAGDPLWADDVGRSFHWLGQAWADALVDLGVEGEITWHRGALCPTEWSPLVCFAGLGPGEVTVAGRKVAGLCQRRRRNGALFQCAALLRWDPRALIDVLTSEHAPSPTAAADLRAAAAGLNLDGGRLEAGFMSRLVPETHRSK